MFSKVQECQDVTSQSCIRYTSYNVWTVQGWCRLPLPSGMLQTEVGQRGQQTSDLLGAKKESKLVGRIHTNLHYTLDWYHGAPLSAA
ncbi:hypothetical protein WJX79_004803 [Trebouxia sp. C0005]